LPVPSTSFPVDFDRISIIENGRTGDNDLVRGRGETGADDVLFRLLVPSTITFASPQMTLCASSLWLLELPALANRLVLMFPAKSAPTIPHQLTKALSSAASHFTKAEAMPHALGSSSMARNNLSLVLTSAGTYVFTNLGIGVAVPFSSSN
jgi:hypothetical protein